MLKDEIEQAKKQGWQSAVVVGEYLLTREDVDTNKLEKSLTQCMDYIMSEAKKKARKGSCCMSDEEVFGLAVHYYDESNTNLKVPKVKGVSTFVSEEKNVESVNQKTLEDLKKAKKELEAAKQELREKDKELEKVTNSLNNAKKESEPTPKKESKPKKKKAKPVEERYVQETLF